MTERIDHLSRAENAMQNGIKLRNAGVINDAIFQATLAQASATLALVEQQRIANIIALSVPQETPSASDVRIPTWDEKLQMRPDVAEGLGLS